MNYRYLAIDFGDSYVGLSVSDGIIPRALPVFNYPNKDYEKLRNYLVKEIVENKISYVIIGIPSNERSFAKIKKIFLLEIFREEFLKEKIIWVNEDDTTKEAIVLKSRRRMREDSISASIILSRFLEKKNYFYMKKDDFTKRITSKDYNFLKRKIENLEISRQNIIEKRKLVDGDRFENADWIVLTEDFEITIKEIDRLRKIVSGITEIVPEGKKTDYVDVGSKVIYEIIGEEDKGKYEVDISHEATIEPFENKISCKSPLGSSLRWKKVNDVIDVVDSNYKVKILEIK